LQIVTIVLLFHNTYFPRTDEEEFTIMFSSSFI
jgi:hypothetical protein